MLSDFTCRSGCEPVPSGTKICPVCGDTISLMNGKTASQINREEKALEVMQDD